jgi:hypothetical protein
VLVLLNGDSINQAEGRRAHRQEQRNRSLEVWLFEQTVDVVEEKE